MPALMPMTAKRTSLKQAIIHRPNGETNFHGHKNNGGSWFNIAHNTVSGKGQNPDGRKTRGHANHRDGYVFTPHLTNQIESDRARGIKHQVSGPAWFDSGAAAFASDSLSRKAAQAMIAKIPLELAQYIGRVFNPASCSTNQGESPWHVRS